VRAHNILQICENFLTPHKSSVGESFCYWYEVGFHKLTQESAVSHERPWIGMLLTERLAVKNCM
jgi:hypothetical protein